LNALFAGSEADFGCFGLGFFHEKPMLCNMSYMLTVLYCTPNLRLTCSATSCAASSLSGVPGFEMS